MASLRKPMIIAYFMVDVTCVSMMSGSAGARNLLQTSMPTIPSLPKPTGTPMLPLPSIPTVTLPQPNIKNVPPLPTNIPPFPKPYAALPPLPGIPKPSQLTLPPLPLPNIPSIPTIPSTIPSIPLFSPPPSN